MKSCLLTYSTSLIYLISIKIKIEVYLRGIMSREEAYEWLSAMLGIPIGNTHIGQMGEYYCQKVIDESKKLLAAHAKRSFRNGCEGRLARCS